MMDPDRWEHGSEFHAPAYRTGNPGEHPWEGQGRLYGSARAALRALLAHGAANLGWRRLHLPSYFCQDVVSAFKIPSIETRTYFAGPAGDERPTDLDALGYGDVLLVVNFFGLRNCAPYATAREIDVQVIEDHTHDPWSDWAATSRADWCVASLRKTLPIPDGAVLWSPAGLPLPAPPVLTEEHARTALDKWAGMGLKALYLAGAPVDKDAFRQMLTSAEERFGAGEPSALSPLAAALLPTLPIAALRKERSANFQVLSAAIEGAAGIEVLHPRGSSACPFSTVLCFDSAERREFVRTRLIGACVYPAVLWQLDRPVLGPIPDEHLQFSQRMLSVHCDARYGEEDMCHVASLLRRFSGEFDAHLGGVAVGL